MEAYRSEQRCGAEASSRATLPAVLVAAGVLLAAAGAVILRDDATTSAPPVTSDTPT
jgi:hypothetical protein